jgi:RNA polymerase sigma factor (sigma-70 family)
MIAPYTEMDSLLGSTMEHFLIESKKPRGRSHFRQVVTHCQDDLQLKAERWLPARLRDQTGVSDLVQETCLRAMRHWEACRGSSLREIRSWLYAILKNQLFNLIKRRRVVDKISVVPRTVDQDKQGETPSRIAIAHEERTLMELSFQQLTDAEQLLLSRYLRDHCTFAQLGQEFGCTEEAARKRWGRALFRWQQLTQNHHA